jgi:molybdopterin synthase catalytic subunit
MTVLYTKATPLSSSPPCPVVRSAFAARLEPGPLSVERETADLIDAAAGAGAIVTFVGVARGSSKSGEQVDRLVLEDHPSLTRQSLDGIAAAAVAKFAVSAVRIAHRTGTVLAGEPIVFAGAAALHRREAFEAVDYLMDRLKTEAVLWKREEGPGASRWIEPTDADYAAKERW